MSEAIKTIELSNGGRIEINYSTGDSREWDNFAKLICFHNRYNLGDDHDYNSDDYSGWDEMRSAIIKREDAAVVLPLYLYDHSGITISTTPFSCPWDSGRVGFAVVSKEKIRERLLAFSDGERRLTNLLHLAEILHQESVEKQTGITGLMKWMSEQINTPVPESEIHQLRLESDEHAVKIITLHKSKGLEFPVVFCPFSWGGSLIKAPEIAFHDHDTKKLTLDLGSSEKDIHLTFAQNELLAENMRLLYVAVTRAIKRCYLVWGRFNTADTSAMAYLFHYGPPPEDDIKIEDLVSSLKSRCSEKKDEELLEDLKQLADKSKGSIVLVPLPANNGMEYASFEDETEEISSRQFSGKIDTSWKISSYSSMVSQRVPEEAVPDRDVSYGYTG